MAFAGHVEATHLPSSINYQGRVLSGTNLVNGTISLTFRIYTNATAGAALYEDSSTATVVDSVYSARIGEHPVSGDLQDALSHHGHVFLEVTINGQTLSPRERIEAVAYAMIARAVVSNSVTSASILDSSVAAVDLDPSVADTFVNQSGDTMTGALVLPENGLVIGAGQFAAYDGRVGVGTTTPQAAFDIGGPTNAGALLFRVMAGTNRVGWARIK